MRRDPIALLRKFMEERELTQPDLAKLIQCDQSDVSKVLSGKRPASARFRIGVERATAKWERGPIRAISWPERKKPGASRVQSEACEPAKGAA